MSAHIPRASVNLSDDFVVKRKDGSHRAGGKHENCRYLVLDLTHDPHAAAAVWAYAKSVQTEDPELAARLSTYVVRKPALLDRIDSALRSLAKLLYLLSVPLNAGMIKIARAPFVELNEMLGLKEWSSEEAIYGELQALFGWHQPISPTAPSGLTSSVAARPAAAYPTVAPTAVEQLRV